MQSKLQITPHAQHRVHVRRKLGHEATEMGLCVGGPQLMQVVNDQHEAVRIVDEGIVYAIGHRANVEPRRRHGRLARLGGIQCLSHRVE